MVAAFAAAAFFQAARALVKPACFADGDAGDAGGADCPDESPAGAVAAVSAGVAEVGAAGVNEELCAVPGAAAG